MNLHEVTFDDVPPFEGYGPDGFRIGGQVHRGALVVHGTRVAGWAGPSEPASLVALAGSVDVILLGMGATIAHAPADLRAAVEEAGIGLEVMDTPAACRTYNVLVGEGRRVAAAVLPVGASD
jgi:uncharacterized protein